ncbi:MAG: hypothetical protein Cons2KO_31650 [Congregibacter sp.]
MNSGNSAGEHPERQRDYALVSIASKINVLITTLAIVAAVTLILFLCQRDFTYQRDALVLEASTRVGSQPQLQLTLYFRDQEEIARTLDGLMSLSPAVKRAVLYDNQGQVIGERSQEWAANDRRPPLSRIREGLSPLDQGQLSLPGGSVPPRLNWLKTVTLGEHERSISIPVVSVVNPTDRALGREDFAAAFAYPELVRSLYVIGYVDVTLSSTVLWSLTLPTLTLSATIGLAIVFFFWLIARISTRRITAPIAELAQRAEDIASGKQTETLRVSGSGEIGEIAKVLNNIITGLHVHTRQMDTDRKILNLKVSERTEQLTKHKEELDKAQQTVTETKDRLRHLAYFDPLTSLPNRRLFTEQLTLLLRLAARNKEKVGLVLIDIDNFKRINESLGTKGGDRLLQLIAERLTQGVRESDLLHRRLDDEASIIDLSRMGGDEFTLVLNQVEGAEAAKLVAKRLTAAIEQPFLIGHQEVMITASMGIALSPQHAADVESLRRAADSAMMEAKKLGRNRVLVYDESMESANRERLQLENDLRKAVERGQLLLHFQPQVRAGDGVIVGVESLVRWNHPTQGLVPPFKWIPVAEELGIIEDIGNWVLREACACLTRLRDAGLELPKVSVNVSALQFNENFAKTVKATLESTGLAPESLELELTEGIMINDEEHTVAQVQRLKDLGIRLSIDDFGTGYSSLSYLSRFPLDEIKIDRSFVLGLSKGQRNVELVRAIIAMSKSLGLEIVVEGVESIEELSFFINQEVEVIQGFLFSAPVPEDKLRQLLAPGHFSAQLELLNQQLETADIPIESA